MQVGRSVVAGRHMIVYQVGLPSYYFIIHIMSMRDIFDVYIYIDQRFHKYDVCNTSAPISDLSKNVELGLKF